jgi:hypothetical protein
VAVAHEVTELAFDLGSGGPIVVAPGGVGLAGPGPGERSLVGADPDRAPTRGGGALRAQLAGGAGLGEVREPVGDHSLDRSLVIGDRSSEQLIATNGDRLGEMITRISIAGRAELVWLYG